MYAFPSSHDWTNNGGGNWHAPNGEIVPGGATVRIVDSGMTLRDYFAVHSVQPGQGEIAAMAGVVYANGAIWSDSQTRIGSFEDWFNSMPIGERLDLFSRVKFAMADAMMKARCA
jgi:hypothetical protein